MSRRDRDWSSDWACWVCGSLDEIGSVDDLCKICYNNSDDTLNYLEGKWDSQY